jgi:hypothetical protein
MTFDISRRGDRTVKLEGPDDMPLRHKFMSSAMFCFGRRGQGKSLGMTCLAEFQRQRYARANNGYQVAANIWMEPAAIINPRMVEDLTTFPDWGRKLFICLDEVGALISNRRSMAKENIGFGAFLTQIRKRKNEFIMTTQFPQWTDLQVLYQIDFFMLMESPDNGRSVHVSVFDWWGQFTGNFKHKRWPPEPQDMDWEFTIRGTESMWRSYNSDQITAPIWAKNKDQIIMTEHGDRQENYDVGYEPEEVEGWADGPAASLEEFLAEQTPGYPVTGILSAVERFTGQRMNSMAAAEHIDAKMGYKVDYTVKPPVIMEKK